MSVAYSSPIPPPCAAILTVPPARVLSAVERLVLKPLLHGQVVVAVAVPPGADARRGKGARLIHHGLNGGGPVVGPCRVSLMQRGLQCARAAWVCARRHLDPGQRRTAG